MKDALKEDSDKEDLGEMDDEVQPSEELGDDDELNAAETVDSE